MSALLTGSDPALLARKYFDSEGWEALPEVLVIVESMMRDIMALRLGSDTVMNESFKADPYKVCQAWRRSMHVTRPYQVP
ncbi:MAG: hypothetical protein MZU79_00175 [Anaerotruncus sp.]|nr:hypothetical protein [Anaerotruncus sp.]